MSDEDIDVDDDIIDDADAEMLSAEKPSLNADADTRRRLEDRLEEARLRKLTQDYDFD